MGTSTEEMKSRIKQLKFPSATDDSSGSPFGVGGGSSNSSSHGGSGGSLSARPTRPRPSLGLSLDTGGGLGLTSPLARRQQSTSGGIPNTNLNAPLSRDRLRLGVFPQPTQDEYERKLEEIMQQTGVLTIEGVRYKTPISDLEALGDLGNGTCGHVVKMRHRETGKIIACKQMRRTGNSEETKRIVMDMDVVLKSHDCREIVVCLGCFITASDVWICMELMATCFDKLLKQIKSPVPENICGKVAVATLNALNYLKESHGVIHRDVKPSNILLDYEGKVKLCDFGISGRLVDSKAKTRSAGCAAYMAPERINPPNPQKPDYDIRADVWSLGITLVELATGQFPYKDCNTEFEVLTKVIQDDPPSLPAHFSSEFKQFVHDCLLKNHKDRPKYKKLLEHQFISKSRDSKVDVGAWYYRVANHSGDPNKTGVDGSKSVSAGGQLARKSSLEQRHEPQTFKPQPSPRMVKSWRMQNVPPLNHSADGGTAASSGGGGLNNVSASSQDGLAAGTSAFSRLKFYTASPESHHSPELNLQKSGCGVSSPRKEETSSRFGDSSTSPRYGGDNALSRYGESSHRYNETTSPRFASADPSAPAQSAGMSSGRYGETSTSPRYDNIRLQDLSIKSYEYGGGVGRYYDRSNSGDAVSGRLFDHHRPSTADSSGGGRLNLNGSVSRSNFSSAYHGASASNYLPRPTYFNSRSHEDYSSALKSPQSKRYDGLGSHSETSSPREYTHSSQRKYSFETLDSSKEHHFTPQANRKYYHHMEHGSGQRKMESPRKTDLPHESQWLERATAGDSSTPTSGGASRTLGRESSSAAASSATPCNSSRKYPALPVPDQQTVRGREPTRGSDSSRSSNFLPPSWKISSWTLSSPLSFRKFRTSSSTDRAFDVSRRQHQAYRSLNERDKQLYSSSGKSENL